MNKDEMDKLLRMVLRGKWDVGEMSRAAETWMGGSRPCSEIMLGDPKPVWSPGGEPMSVSIDLASGDGDQTVMSVNLVKPREMSDGEPEAVSRKKPHEMSDDELDEALRKAGADVSEEDRQEILDEIKLRAVKKGMEAGVEIGRQRAEKEAAEKVAAAEAEAKEAREKAEAAEDMERRVVEKAVQEMEKRRLEREKKAKEDEEASKFVPLAPPPSTPYKKVLPPPPRRWTAPMVGGDEEDWDLKMVQGGFRE